MGFSNSKSWREGRMQVLAARKIQQAFRDYQQTETYQAKLVARQQSAATTLQRVIRGAQVRKHLRVKTILPGVVSIRVHADESWFARIHINLDRRGVSRELELYSIDAARFNVTPVGSLLQHWHPTKINVSTDTVYINASFFNERRGLSRMYPQTACIGASLFVEQECDLEPALRKISHQKKPHPQIKPESEVYNGWGIAPPKAYSQHYHTLVTTNGYLSGAPLLAKDGQSTFTQAMVDGDDAHFSFDKTEHVAPGTLYHADCPNPRAAVVIPTEGAAARFYTAIALSPGRGYGSEGMTLPEWSEAMARISRLSGQRGTALNFDGGYSVSMGVIQEGRVVHSKHGQQYYKTGYPAKAVPSFLFFQPIQDDDDSNASPKSAAKAAP